TATTDDGQIMAVRHATLPVVGLQFHPESVLTEGGLTLLQNFLRIARRPRLTETLAAACCPPRAAGVGLQPAAGRA
ncbi:MAG: hypothetical protein AAF790_13000, partial [Planctomycetota bacterium]